ncbi:hypothetical protein HDU76_000394 [Blyttiomyces sp. JEL0837]|nr:hypothetical protein HDU76_000394 [Blyttiomyces sp. JEL0837]
MIFLYRQYMKRKRKQQGRKYRPSWRPSISHDDDAVDVLEPQLKEELAEPSLPDIENPDDPHYHPSSLLDKPVRKSFQLNFTHPITGARSYSMQRHSSSTSLPRGTIPTVSRPGSIQSGKAGSIRSRAGSIQYFEASTPTRQHQSIVSMQSTPNRQHSLLSMQSGSPEPLIQHRQEESPPRDEYRPPTLLQSGNTFSFKSIINSSYATAAFPPTDGADAQPQSESITRLTASTTIVTASPTDSALSSTTAAARSKSTSRTRKLSPSKAPLPSISSASPNELFESSPTFDSNSYSHSQGRFPPGEVQNSSVLSESSTSRVRVMVLEEAESPTLVLNLEEGLTRFDDFLNVGEVAPTTSDRSKRYHNGGDTLSRPGSMLT